MSEPIGLEPGSGNVFADLEFAEPEVMLAKAHLVHAIAVIVDQRRMAPDRAAEVIGVPVDRYLDMVKGHFEEITSDQLLGFLNALDFDVSISVIPRREPRERATVTVLFDDKNLAIASA